MKVELMVNGLLVAEFDGSSNDALQFQASMFHYMAEAQSELMTAASAKSRRAFSMLNDIQFGTIKRVPMDPHSADPTT